jgi:hypothetical protein
MKQTPASLRSDLRPLCPGLPGRFALDWVAGLTGIRNLFSCNTALPSSRELFVRTYADRIGKLIDLSEEHRRLMREFGMWNTEAT